MGRQLLLPTELIELRTVAPMNGNESGRRTVMDDDWIKEFQKRAGARLKPIFEKDLDRMPPKLVRQLERLRQVENQLLKQERKKPVSPAC